MLSFRATPRGDRVSHKRDLSHSGAVSCSSTVTVLYYSQSTSGYSRAKDSRSDPLSRTAAVACRRRWPLEPSASRLLGARIREHSLHHHHCCSHTASLPLLLSVAREASNLAWVHCRLCTDCALSTAYPSSSPVSLSPPLVVVNLRPLSLHPTLSSIPGSVARSIFLRILISCHGGRDVVQQQQWSVLGGYGAVRPHRPGGVLRVHAVQ